MKGSLDYDKSKLLNYDTKSRFHPKKEQVFAPFLVTKTFLAQLAK